jgi:hypothetical protein
MLTALIVFLRALGLIAADTVPWPLRTWHCVSSWPY